MVHLLERNRRKKATNSDKKIHSQDIIYSRVITRKITREILINRNHCWCSKYGLTDESKFVSSQKYISRNCCYRGGNPSTTPYAWGSWKDEDWRSAQALEGCLRCTTQLYCTERIKYHTVRDWQCISFKLEQRVLLRLVNTTWRLILFSNESKFALGKSG